MSTTFRIAEAAQPAEFTPATWRDDEDIGLLTPTRLATRSASVEAPRLEVRR